MSHIKLIALRGAQSMRIFLKSKHIRDHRYHQIYRRISEHYQIETR